MKKRLTIIATAVVIVIVILLIILIKPKKSVETEYQTALITKGQIENTVTATGTIEPIIQVEVGTQVSGIIDHIYVDFNSRVKKGEVLAELDKTNLEAELRSSEATLESSKTEFEYQKKNYERSKALYDKKLISDTEYESSKYNYDKAESAFTKANSDIRKVRQNLAYATIYSPIDGVVLDRAVDEGQTVAASFNTPTLFIIANDLTRMQVIANVDEADIGEVKEGQKVTFTVDAFPDDIFNGNVTQVRLQPTTTSNVVTYEVVVDAFNPNYKLKPGLTANITIITMEKEDILMVPVKA
ncbi:MAG TPA: efflux RND transporter periplasmic adaptor subunit, partial [Bacteroidales bacterium]|nr:efflux RND transporter periplasmic adaptor subunit [Bacteroidales bacterium]